MYWSLEVEVPELGRLVMDVAYGGNFYAIIERQENFYDLADLTPGDIQRLSPLVRQLMNEAYTFVHPENPEIQGLSRQAHPGPAGWQRFPCF